MPKYQIKERNKNMELIHFIADNSDTNYNCIMSTMDNRVKLNLGDNKIDEALVLQGFNILNENNFFVQGDYSAYKYIYYRDGSEFTLTKDENDKYVEPGTPTPDPVYKPTVEEKEAQKKAELESAKESKIAELNNVCAKKIEEGIEYNNKKYSYTVQDQSNMLNAMNLAKETGMEIPYHADGESCSLYNYDTLASIYMMEQMNITTNQTYFNQIKLYVLSNSDTNDIDKVKEIKYGDELTGEYLAKYNEIMEQSNKVMQKLISLEYTNSEKETV